MTGKDAIKATIGMADMVLQTYVGDLSDADLMIRSAPGVNHIAWQLGHLVCSENKMLTDAGVKMPDLPDGFEASYTKETSTSNDAGKFHKKAEYLAAMTKQRAGTMAALDAASDSDLGKVNPEEMHMYAKTLGDAFNMIGLHVMMHVGQFVPVRRMQGKPVSF